MSSVTGGSIINLALADLEVIRPGETVSATVTADCLVRLNMLLGSLSAEQLMAQTQQHGVFPLQTGVDRYTFGVGGTFGTLSRPIKATAWEAYYGPFKSGGKVLTFEELQQVAQEPLGRTSALPAAVGADTAYPLIHIAVFPLPNSTPGAIEITYWTAITEFPDTTTPQTFPDGWPDLLHFNLAMALLPRYGRQGFDATALAANAQSTKSKIATLNQGTAPQAAA